MIDIYSSISKWILNIFRLLSILITDIAYSILNIIFKKSI